MKTISEKTNILISLKNSWLILVTLICFGSYITNIYLTTVNQSESRFHEYVQRNDNQHKEIMAVVSTTQALVRNTWTKSMMIEFVNYTNVYSLSYEQKRQLVDDIYERHNPLF